jgi:SAM-dependent methyltransferase
MSKTIEDGRQEVARLCEYFATNREKFRAPGVKEAHIRQTLIDPFFEALGWDVRNLAMAAPQYREVVTEDSVEVAGRPKAPDNAFRVGTMTKFYAEAKRCVVNIKTDAISALQLRGYGWSAKVPLSILTNFEELASYDCTLEPKDSHTAGRARVLYLRYDEYVERWRELWDVYSREAVWSGAFDEYAASKRKRGTAQVDDAFLKTIEGWRETLARNIALRNPDLSSDDLNAAVQRTIDRVVFLRMAEDRGLEPYQQLSNLCDAPDTYARFMRVLCRRADDKYNSGLCHFQPEPGVVEPPDRITPGLTVDDRVFQPILRNLYFDHGSYYHFGVMPVEILGTVYERFLGKVIRRTAGGQAKVEEKPEVRKAGGVYYTPAYIVNYIVEQTVGRQIKGKSPMQLAGQRNGKQPFRVLDLACGSGSFLLGAYQFLLDHCLKWYLDHNPQKHKRAIYNGRRTGQWRLTIEEKKRILTTHLFGVDIDPQAVEVSKLSLLLKVLEGENDQSVMRQMQLFEARALPNLAENIKCGNSLIGPDYFTGRLLADAADLRRVNAFDWNTEFAAAMDAGGFDCVIGNPPYVRIQTLRDTQPEEFAFLTSAYSSASQGNADLYVVFLERALQLLNDRGNLGYIIPNKFLRTDYGARIRKLLADERAVGRIVDFGHDQVFTATTYTCLVFLNHDRGKRVFDFGQSPANADALSRVTFSKRKLKELSDRPWTFESAESAALIEKMEGRSKQLLDLPATMSRGSSTGADDVFVFERGTLPMEEGIVRQPLFATDFDRYTFAPARKWEILFPYTFEDGDYRLLTEAELRRRFPRALEYLSANRKKLKRRKQFKAWYGYSAPRNLALHEQSQIAVPLLADKGSFAFIPERSRGEICPMASGGFTISLSDDSPLTPKYLLGILNSRLLFWRLRTMSNMFRGGWITCTKQYFGKLPIRVLELGKKSELVAHDRMVELVESMMSLQSNLAEARSVAQEKVIQRQIDATDAQIDRLVYELYDLTAAEIALVEERAAKAVK